MTRLSVNINKIATLRNARGGNLPDVEKAARDIEIFGAEGITVHPRPDERHIRYSDVRQIRPVLKTEFNIEGNPIPSFRELVLEVVPDQVTLVPDGRDALTSNAGWDTVSNRDFLLDFMLQGLDVEPNRLAQPVADEPLDAVYDDPWLSVVNKPAGMLSVPGKLLDDSLLSRYQAAHPEATGPIVVHRLDQETSGLVLFAKTKYVHKSLQSQFADHRIHKEYVALLSGAVKDDEGIIELPIRPDIDDRPRQRVDTTAGKRAVTRYRVLRRHAATTLVAFEPVTGRTHQLRVHASHPAGLGCPIVGDALYGQPDRRLFLHARQLSFTHPVTGQVVTARREESFTTAMTQQNRKQYHVVAAVIEHHRRILCMQRGLTRYSYTSYHWEFPGGKIEAGETPQQALHRELHEEMDYDVTVGPHLVTVTHSYPDFDITMEAYLCRAKTRRFTLREHHAYCWLTPEQLDTLPWCAADVPIQEAMSRRAHGL